MSYNDLANKEAAEKKALQGKTLKPKPETKKICPPKTKAADPPKD